MLRRALLSANEELSTVKARQTILPSSCDTGHFQKQYASLSACGHSPGAGCQGTAIAEDFSHANMTYPQERACEKMECQSPVVYHDLRDTLSHTSSCCDHFRQCTACPKYHSCPAVAPPLSTITDNIESEERYR